MNTITEEYFLRQVDYMYDHFNENMKNHKLFMVDVDWNDVWNVYEENIPDNINPVYRSNNLFKCSKCRHFFHKAANIVAVDEDSYEYITLFDCERVSELEDVFEKLSRLIKKAEIRDIFLSNSRRLGTREDKEMLDDGSIISYNHFYLDIPEELIGSHQQSMSARTDRSVLEKSTLNISMSAVNVVLELIETDSIYRASEWKNVLRVFKGYLREYENINDSDKNKFFWIKSVELGPIISKIKNRSIGILLTDLTNDMPLEDAVRKYEGIVAPTNYKRPKPILNESMIKNAQKKMESLGFADSIPRRYATINDISINDMLFVNRDVKPLINESKDIFENLKRFIVYKTHNFDKIQEINLDDFIEKVLPTALEVEVYLSHELNRNFVSLIAPVNADAPGMFKWNNPFSWTYIYNLSDSVIKQRVKAMGGDVDVDLRFSIQWNTGNWDKNDLDAHCTEPDNNEIYYYEKNSSKTKGWLDVDIINPIKNKPAVENIQYKDRNDMMPGEYLFRVHQYSYRGGDDGFDAEIEFDGKIHEFLYPYKLNPKEYVDVAKLTVNDRKEFKLTNILDTTLSNKKAWNLTFNTFIPVSLICYSPNYWADNAIGNKHIFFMLKDCVNEDTARPWFNEYLSNDLHEHRRVTEALSSTAKVEKTDNQLSGLGFSLTQRNRITVKVKSKNVERMFNVMI